MRKQRLTSTMGDNLRMNDETYALRRKVMGHIYEAKQVLRNHGIDLVRVGVRITEDSSNEVLATAYLGGDTIHVAKGTVERYPKQLKEIVYHELIHAVLGIGHWEGCPLMCATLGAPMTDKQVDEIFLKYFV